MGKWKYTYPELKTDYYIYYWYNEKENMGYVGQATTGIGRLRKYFKIQDGGPVQHNRFFENELRAHPKDFKLTIIEYVEALNADDAISKLNPREQYWIAEKNTLYPNGYNLNPGGDNHSFKHKQESKDQMSNTRKTKHINGKGIVCLNHLTSFYTQREAANYYKEYKVTQSKINMVCNGKRKYTGSLNGERLVFRRIEDFANMTQQEIDEAIQNAYKK